MKDKETTTEDRSLLVNFSNHPCSKWSKEQMDAAMTFCNEVVDLPFPMVPASADEGQIDLLAQECFSRILEIAAGREVAVHVVGEFTLTVNVVERCKAAGIPCMASCSERISEDGPAGEKISRFVFSRFRRY